MKTFIAFFVFLSTLFSSISYAKKPNFIIIFTDDQGYQDVGCFGSPNIKTPNLDKMASEGMKFTSFYAQTVCGPSRAALMTGSYPLRNKREDDGKPAHPELSLSEITIAEIVKTVGYETGMIGKWDLAGHNTLEFNMNLRPENQGFDYSFWTPSSNDRHVDLYTGSKSLKKNVDMSTLTSLYTDKAIEFIKEKKKKPFFLYLAHTMPHVKLAVSQKFKGKSKGGFYGDVIEEIDYNVGRILDEIKSLGLDDNTYVIFTSDNGPWWIKKEHSGHCAPFRGAKTSTYEGGLRVPFIIRAPGKVPAGTTSDLVTATIDMLPTIAQIVKAEMPKDRVIDGLDISEIFHGKQTELDRPFFFYQHQALRAVRQGDWKLHLPHSALDKTKEGKTWQRHISEKDRTYIRKITLYNLKEDKGETINVAKNHPDIVKKLLKQIDYAKKDIGYHNINGENSRRDLK